MNKIINIHKCKTFRKALQTLMGQQVKKGNHELEFYTKSILDLYNRFHPEKIVPVEVQGWHGKSSFELIKEIDKLVIIKYQKPKKGSEPLKVVTEASREELNALINAIKFLWENRENKEKGIPTRLLTMAYSGNMHLNHSDWKKGDKPFFSDRKEHNHLTLMLGALDRLGLIKYEGGYTTVLNNKLDIQLILK